MADPLVGIGERVRYLIAPRYGTHGRKWALMDSTGVLYFRESVQELLDCLLRFSGRIEVEIRP